MRRSKAIRRILIPLLVYSLLAACSWARNSSGPASPTSITPAEGKGGMRGVIANITNFWERGTVYVFAAEYHGNEKGEGIYVLEPSIHPFTTVDIGGLFQITDMPPGEYVLIVGPTPEEAAVVRKGDDATIYKVTANEVTEVGAINLTW